ncbi:MAG: GNAT family N-acetyltransferase [Ignavibacteriae bacterium]|nr:MAG: GNAT family N-acetyltransferase [Ignavibacteriota bacterium]
MKNIIIKQANNDNEIKIIKQLFLEYANSLNFDLCFQDFDKEIEGLPGKYDLPAGRLLICYVDDTPAGCIALRKIDDEICEMKRLYVKPEFRGYKIGLKLVEYLLNEARNSGYKKMRLDTLPVMDKAINLYKQFGFYEIEPYIFNPLPEAKYMERVL